MNIVLFGPQGCGKGTEAAILKKDLGLYHLSMGDELRAEVKRGTPLGKKIEKIINGGNLVPDSITEAILLKVAKSKDAHNGMIFDGFPRRNSQLVFLLKHFKIDVALEMKVPESVSIRRASTRCVCTKCKRNFNILTLKPKKVGVCDSCGGTLVQRDDDKPKEIKKRLAIYKTQTMPMRETFSKQNILHVIDSNRTITAVDKDIKNILKKISKGKKSR